MLSVSYIGDNKPVIDKYRDGREACNKSANADLYRLLFHYVDTKNITLNIKWMPSHLDTEPEKERPGWVNDYHIIGNNQADRLAGISAAQGSLDMNVVSKVVWYTSLVKNIQARFAAIICNLPNRHRIQRPVITKPTAPSKELLLTLSKHAFVMDGAQLRCNLCKCTVGYNSPDVKSVLGSDCIPLRTQPNKPTMIRFLFALLILLLTPLTLFMYSGVLFTVTHVGLRPAKPCVSSLMCAVPLGLHMAIELLII